MMEAQFLPDPEPSEVLYTIISVDDHLVEPPDVFEGRLPKSLEDQAPHIVVDDAGVEAWAFDGRLLRQPGSLSLSGRKIEMLDRFTSNYAEMRRGCYDIKARIADMDLCGIWASLSFPSDVAGFCGRQFAAASNSELGQACVRAWNDWLFEDWYSPFPERIIPMGLAYLADPLVAAAEIRRNAERGFRSVSMPARPQQIGLPSLWRMEYWDPIIEACVETDTVISIHVGSSGPDPVPEGAGVDYAASLFSSASLSAAAEWLWSKIPLRFPDIKIAMSEGGIGWVAMYLDRLDNLVDRSGYGRTWTERPADIFQRNFWFCTLDDPSTIDTRHRIGVDHIMVEVDYPHADSTWPDTQSVLRDAWGHLPSKELRAICSENAAKLYRHPLPPVVLPATE
jgi:predicted TIM-barrel fold metal-dependent hydrolase